MPPGLASPWYDRLGPPMLGLVLLAVYLSNGRELGSYDTIPTALTTFALVRGDGPFLDRFERLLIEPDGRRSPYVEKARTGHLVSRYPVGAAFIAAPLVAPQVLYLDLAHPGWDRNRLAVWSAAQIAAKHAAAALTALTGALLFRLFLNLGLRRAALPAALAAALGSDLWAVASQAIWQHGPAALSLTLLMLLLSPTTPSFRRWTLAGLAAGLLVACRPLDLVLLLPLLPVLAIRSPRRLVTFLPGHLLVAGLALAWNVHQFGTISGGQAALEGMHPTLHQKPAGVFSGNPVEGLAGTLVSPARGLLIYSPWVIAGLAALPRTWTWLREHPPLRLLVAGLGPFLVVLSFYPVWWGGFCFGPRYWTDAVPLLALLFAVAFEHAAQAHRLRRLVCLLAILIAVAIQSIGAYCYPSSWALKPTNIDRDHARLWSWRDNELTRSVAETLHPGG